ncbi:hypothetical protein [Nonomuraea sp. B19D2]|uniref:hypothetical protein n=1 Tax=Nonomuraea sp. B19D2 TaxID=3159561 RepID=UPI0032DADC27
MRGNGRRRAAPWLAAIAALLVATIIVYVMWVFVVARSSDTRPRMSVPGSAPDATWGQLAVLVAVMVAGLVAGHLFEELKKASGRISIIAELRGITSSPRFWMALLVGPIVFMSVYLAIKDHPHTLADYLLAFQNGFWWETVLQLRKGGLQPEETSASPAGVGDVSGAGEVVPE